MRQFFLFFSLSDLFDAAAFYLQTSNEGWEYVKLTCCYLTLNWKEDTCMHIKHSLEPVCPHAAQKHKYKQTVPGSSPLHYADLQFFPQHCQENVLRTRQAKSCRDLVCVPPLQPSVCARTFCDAVAPKQTVHLLPAKTIVLSKVTIQRRCAIMTA